MMQVFNSSRVQAPAISPHANASRSQARPNDGESPNPNRRDPLESRSVCGKQTKQNNSKFLKCKKCTNISTMNVRTLRQKSKRLELINSMSRHSISILAIIDHKICHEDEINYEQLDRHTLITSSAWRNANNASAGGVGIIVNRNAECNLAEIIKFNDRILIAHFNGNPATSIIVHYSPCEGASDAEEHYENLTAATASVPKHNTILVLGDFNAHLGSSHSSAPFSYHNDTNKNGQLLIDYLQESNMMVGNTNFRKKHSKLWTFISDMSGSKTQVDYILINRKWKNSLKNCEAYNSFSNIGSDHRIVTAKLKLSLRVPRKVARIRYDWNALKDSNIQEQYTIALRNRYQLLCNEPECSNATKKYQNFITAHEEASKEHIPQKTATRKKKRMSDDTRITSARESVNSAFTEYAACTSVDNHENLQEKKKSLQIMYDVIQEEELSEMITKVEQADANSKHGMSWRLINEITGRKDAKKGIIKGKSKSERLTKWHDYFKGLLGDEPVVTNREEDIETVFEPLNIHDGPFTMEEYQQVKRKISNGKAAGPDGIPPEVFKLTNIDDIILEFANNLLNNFDKPEQWSINQIQPIPKSGDLSNVGNYRGIALSAIAAKIVNKMLLNRIQPVLDPLLRPNQNGFRPGRSTAAHILALRRVIEGVYSQNRKAIIIFVDFKKAFDTIHRGKMLEILRKYGVPDKLVMTVEQLYIGTFASVLSPDGETDKFEIKAGVLQGDTLAPYLFAIVVDYAMRQAIRNNEEELGFMIQPSRSRRHPAVCITDLMFADDIALLSQEIAHAQELLTRVEIEAAKIGLHLNAKKTELITFNFEDEITILTTKGNKVANVLDFKYLGGWMASSEKDFEIRKAMAWSACNKLKLIWSSNLSKFLKIRLFRATVESVLLYNSETWTINKSMQRKIDGCYTRMLRMALNISWKTKTSNVDLYQKLPPVSQTIRERRLRLSGHLVRHNEELAHNLVLWEPTGGRRNRGRQPVSYTDVLKQDTGLESIDELKTAMLDRNDWKKRIKLGRADARPR